MTPHASDTHALTVVATAATLTLLLAAPPLAAQVSNEPPATRESLLQSARDALARTSVPPKPSRVERGLYWYDTQYVLAKFFAGWHGVHLAGGDFPAGAGAKFGVGYDKGLTTDDPDITLANRLDLAIVGAYSTAGYTRIRGSLSARNLGGAPVEAIGFGQFYEFPQEDYFGPGIDSWESNRTNYLLDVVETGGAVSWRPRMLDVRAGASLLSPRVGRGTDTLFPSTEEVFNGDTAPGLGTQTDFAKLEASAAVDWRDNPSFPHAGGRYEATVARFEDRDLNQFDFSRVDVHLQQYIPLGNRYRVLALRAIGAFTDGDAGHSVPFYLQPVLGGHRDLRGFRENRFRDENSLLIGAEYRWEAWWALDGALFVDAGMVAPSRRDLSLREMDVSYGVGFRFHNNSALIGRLDLAFSREGFIPLLRFEHVF